MKEIQTEKVLWSDWKIYERTKCDIRTRVMGYIRPVSGYNPWKKSEFYGRVNFQEGKIDNSPFIRKYANNENKAN